MNYHEAWANGEIEAGTLVDAIESLTAELAELKAQPGRVVLPLMAALESVVHDERVPNEVSQEVAAVLIEAQCLNSSPVSAGDDRETIRAVFLRNGFTIKEGQADLKPYVYAAADELMSIARAALSAPSHGEQVREWSLAADELPSCGKPVLAYYLNSHGMKRRIRAMHVKRFTVEAEEFADPDTQCVEYSEQDDCYYTTEGWYELIDNWPDYSSCAVIEGVITHWMPLPAAPSAGSQKEQGE